MHFKGEFLYNFLILFCYFIIGFRRAKSGFLCAKGKSGRKNKKHLPYAPEDEVDAEDVVTYEEVALYYPRADRKRPVVLIGKKHALKKYDQFALNTSCFWRSTGSHEFFVTKIMKNSKYRMKRRFN